jgi:hypothetical protein
VIGADQVPESVTLMRWNWTFGDWIDVVPVRPTGVGGASAESSDGSMGLLLF